MSGGTIEQVANANDPTEQGYLDQARAALKAGMPADHVATRLTQLVHTYRSSLASKPDAAAPETAGEHVAGLLGNAYQGLTLGAGDKITAAMQSLAQGGGIDPASLASATVAFPQNLKDMAGVNAQFAGRHPLEAFAAEAAGSLPTLALGAGAKEAEALAKMGTAKKALALAKSGAAIGGVTGALGSESLDDLPENALKGAGLGFVAAPAIGLPLGAVAGKIGRAFAGPNTTATRVLGGALRAGEVDPAALAQEAGSSPALTVMDAGGPVRSLARQAANVPGSTARQQIEDALIQRSAGTGPRIQSALSQGTGFRPEEFSQTADALIQQARDDSRPLYEAAFGGGDTPYAPSTISLSSKAGEGGPTLRDVLNRPSMQNARVYGDKLALEEGGTPMTTASDAPKAPKGFSSDQWDALLRLNPQMGDANVPVQDLHNLKMRLDDMLGYAKRSGQLPDGSAATRKMLGAIAQTRGALLDIMDAHAPDYGVARRAYAGPAAMKDAFEAGADHFSPSLSPADAHAQLSDLNTTAEQDMYRRGALSSLRERIQNMTANPDLPEAARQTNIVQRILGSDPQNQKAAMLFHSPEAYQEFLGQMATESRFPKTQQFLLNQSSTAAQQAERGMPVNAWTALSAAKGNPLSAMRLATQVLGRKGPAMSVPVANALGEQLQMSGPALQALLTRIGQQGAPGEGQAALQRLIGRASSVAAAP